MSLGTSSSPARKPRNQFEVAEKKMHSLLKARHAFQAACRLPKLQLAVRTSASSKAFGVPWLLGWEAYLPCVGWLSAGCVCVCSHPWGARFCPAAAQDYNGNGIVSLAEVDGCVTAPGLQPGLSRED